MSKERLEEIKKRVLTDKVYYKYIDSKGYWGKTYTLSDEDYKYLMRQAKRVQELESKVKQLNRETLTLNSIKKRYKEALDIMVVHADDPDAVKDIYNELVIKMDRLEGSE